MLTEPDDPPPAPLMLADQNALAPLPLEAGPPAFTEYPEPGQDALQTGGWWGGCLGGGKEVMGW